MDLFDYMREKTQEQESPLASRLRPQIRPDMRPERTKELAVYFRAAFPLYRRWQGF